MKEIVARTGKALVVIWGNPDPDAIASAYALRTLLAMDAANYTISYMGEFTRPENLAMVKTLRIPMEKFSADMAEENSALITVDAQPSFFQNSLPRPFDIAIDHHPRKEIPRTTFADIRPTYASTATILTEYFRDTNTEMPKYVATALFYGLEVDTGNLQRKVSDADINAFRYLRNRADENIIRTIEYSQLPMNLLDYFGIALARKKAIRDAIFTYIGRVDNPDVGVHVADFYIKVAGISWVAVASLAPGKLVVIFRSDGLREHVGKIASDLFGKLGTAGGHRVMARAEIDLKTLRQEIPDLSDANIENWLLEKLGTRIRGFRKIHAAGQPTPLEGARR